MHTYISCSEYIHCKKIVACLIYQALVPTKEIMHTVGPLIIEFFGAEIGEFNSVLDKSAKKNPKFIFFWTNRQADSIYAGQISSGTVFQ